MNIHSAIGTIVPFFRKKRMARFVNTVSPSAETDVLDVGGGAYNWDLISAKFKVTLLNLYKLKEMLSAHGYCDFVVGDGTALTYSDNSFDIVYSNSVMEHLYTWEKQRKFASALNRVWKRLGVQTPAKSFFIEPHLITQFVLYLPKIWQRHLLQNFTVWGWIARLDQKHIDQFLNEVRLLTYYEMKLLFPDCIIEKEKFLFFTKCYVAVRK